MGIVNFVWVCTVAQSNDYLVRQFQGLISALDQTSSQFEIVEWLGAKAEIERLEACSNEL